MTTLLRNLTSGTVADTELQIASAGGRLPFRTLNSGAGEHDEQTPQCLVDWASRIWQVAVAEESAMFVSLRAEATFGAEVSMGRVRHPLAPPDAIVAEPQFRVHGIAEGPRRLPTYAWLYAGASAAKADSSLKRADDPRARRTLAWRRLEGKLSRWSTLPDDWDGDGGVAPSQEVLGAVGNFMKRARAEFVPPPEIYLTGDGEVGLRWRGLDAFASAAFLPDKHIVIYSKVGNEPTLRLDELYSPALDLSGLFGAVSIIG